MSISLMVIHLGIGSVRASNVLMSTFLIILDFRNLPVKGLGEQVPWELVPFEVWRESAVIAESCGQLVQSSGCCRLTLIVGKRSFMSDLHGLWLLPLALIGSQERFCACERQSVLFNSFDSLEFNLSIVFANASGNDIMDSDLGIMVLVIIMSVMETSDNTFLMVGIRQNKVHL